MVKKSEMWFINERKYLAFLIILKATQAWKLGDHCHSSYFQLVPAHNRVPFLTLECFKDLKFNPINPCNPISHKIF